MGVLEIMKKRVFIVIAIVLAVAAGLTASVAAQGHRHQGWILRHMTKELNLTDAQQTQIKGILAAEKSKTQPLMKQLRDNRIAASNNFTGNFDEAQVRAQANQQAQIMSDLMVERARAKSQIYAVLTPEQQAKAQQLMQQRQQRWQQHGKKGLPQTQATPQQ
jgi:Spy/CpxP family protein refolding chaperone